MDEKIYGKEGRCEVCYKGISVSVVCIVSLIQVHIEGAQSSFQGLGVLPGITFVEDISADGNVVIGTLVADSLSGFRWTRDQGFSALEDVPNGTNFMSPQAISANGSIIVGLTDTDSGRLSFKWENNVSTSLGVGSGAHAVSADGSVIAGTTTGRNGYVWDSGDVTFIGDGVLKVFPRGMNSDGTVVVGEIENQAFRWSQNTIEPLGFLDGGSSFSIAWSASSDGQVIVGGSDSQPLAGFPNSEQAFLWTEEDGMVGLGFIPGGSLQSMARDVSADGSIIVGDSGGDTFIWDKDNGMRSLKSVLEGQHGLDLTGWELDRAIGISDDGMTIVGDGKNPLGAVEGWIATIPEPATFSLLLLGVLALQKRSKTPRHKTRRSNNR